MPWSQETWIDAQRCDDCLVTVVTTGDLAFAGTFQTESTPYLMDGCAALRALIFVWSLEIGACCSAILRLRPSGSTILRLRPSGSTRTERSVSERPAGSPLKRLSRNWHSTCSNA